MKVKIRFKLVILYRKSFVDNNKVTNNHIIIFNYFIICNCKGIFILLFLSNFSRRKNLFTGKINIYKKEFCYFLVIKNCKFWLKLLIFAYIFCFILYIYIFFL